MMLLMVALLFAGAQTLSAQRTITGTVISADDNMTVPGASVSVRGTTIGTMTDINGRFSLNVPADATHLVFSFMGMETQEIEIVGRATIDVRLTSGAIGLEEFVVLGFGTARRVGNQVGSMQQVTAESLEARPVANVMDALQGRVAGLQVFQSSGEPSAAPTVRLHGIGSLGAGSAPLFILDGIQVDSRTIQSMNPNDFESVTVLRDASATTIFGARAANGVIVITTKRGLRNEDARIQVRHQFGVSQLAERRIQDGMMSTTQLYNFFLETGMNPTAVNQIRASDYLHGRRVNTRWLDYFMRDNVPTFQTDVSVRGGGGRTTYFISANHFLQEGTAYGSFFERYSGRINLESQAKNWLRVGMNVNLSRDTRRSNANFAGGGGLILSGAGSVGLQPWISPYDENGNLLSFVPGLAGGAGMHLPHYMTRLMHTYNTSSQMTGSFFVEMEPIQNLRLITRAGSAAFDWQSVATRMPSASWAVGNGQRGFLSQQFIRMTINNVIEYSFNIGSAHNFTALLGHEGISFNQRVHQASISGLTDDRLIELGDGPANLRAVGSSTTTYAFLSYFGRIDYNFNERFFGEVTVRNDASSRFGRDNRNAWFWAVGGMWRMTNEPFIRDIALITDARLNISYGTQGNAEVGGNFLHLAQVGSIGNYMDIPGWGITNPGNAGLMWEQQSKLTIGLRTELMHRHNIAVEFYQRMTTNMLLDMPFPGTAGFTQLNGNVGALRNRGIDITLGTEIIRRRDWHIGADFVFNYNRETVMELWHGEHRHELFGARQAWVVGKPIMHYGQMFGGICPTNGRLWWYLPGEDIDITTRDPRRTTQTWDDEGLFQNTGFRRFAPINGGFGMNAGWRGLTLNAHFAFVLGKWMWCNNSLFSFNAGEYGRDGSNLHYSVTNFWRQPGDIARFPDWTQPDQLLRFDTQFLSNASFVRLKDLTLSYNLPESILQRTNFFRNVRVFATGRNLLTFTNFMGVDPEVDSNMALNVYGNSRQFQFGLELVF